MAVPLPVPVLHLPSDLILPVFHAQPALPNPPTVYGRAVLNAETEALV